MARLNNRNPMAREVRSAKYRPQVVKLKNKTLPRKAKHKGIQS
jgi:hypothetical protein